MAEAGEKEGSIVFAEEQTSGRGRLGRKWLSPKGANILLSIILRPRIEPKESFLITMVASIAIILVAIPSGITLIVIWRLKRLPEFHSLLAAIAIVIIVLGQILENILSGSSILWISEGVDLLGWITLYLSTVIRPNYT